MNFRDCRSVQFNVNLSLMSIENQITRFLLNELSMLISSCLIGLFEENKRTVKRANFEKIKNRQVFFSFFYSLGLMYIQSIDHLFVSLSLARISIEEEDDERRCIGRGVNVVFFFFFSLFLADANVVLPSMCYFLLTVGWRSFFFFVFFCRLPSGSLDQWPRKAREREKERREACHCSFFFILSERTTTKEMSG